jgi:hypothetical protein
MKLSGDKTNKEITQDAFSLNRINQKLAFLVILGRISFGAKCTGV